MLSDTNNRGVLIGIVVGVVVGVIAIALGILFWCCRRRKSKRSDGSPEEGKGENSQEKLDPPLLAADTAKAESISSSLQTNPQELPSNPNDTISSGHNSSQHSSEPSPIEPTPSQVLSITHEVTYGVSDTATSTPTASGPAIPTPAATTTLEYKGTTSLVQYDTPKDTMPTAAAPSTKVAPVEPSPRPRDVTSSVNRVPPPSHEPASLGLNNSTSTLTPTTRAATPSISSTTLTAIPTPTSETRSSPGQQDTSKSPYVMSANGRYPRFHRTEGLTEGLPQRNPTLQSSSGGGTSARTSRVTFTRSTTQVRTSAAGRTEVHQSQSEHVSIVSAPKLNGED